MSAIRLLPGWTLHTHDRPDSERQYRQIWTDGRDLRTFRTDEDPARYRVDFAHLVSLEILPDTREIFRHDKVADLPQSTFDHVLADQIAPRLLAHGGQFVIHAAAIQQGDSVLLFIGDSGSGKSTLAASFSQSGWTLMGDDGVIVDEHRGDLLARAIYPSLRLLPDSMEELFSEPTVGEPIAHYSTKRHVPAAVSGAAAQARGRISAIFLLLPPASDRTSFGKFSEAEACMTLIENSFALDPTDLRLAQIQLVKAARLAACAPVFSLKYPRQFARLPEAREIILRAAASTEPLSAAAPITDGIEPDLRA